MSLYDLIGKFVSAFVLSMDHDEEERRCMENSQ